MNAQAETILDAALVAVCAADATITKADADAAKKRLAGAAGEPQTRMIRTKEACRLLGVGVKTLRAWAARGRLVPCYGGNENFRVGYTAESVRAILAGRH